MGAGISKSAKRARIYRGLKKAARRLAENGIDSVYINQEIRGVNFVVYYAGIGPASNGDSLLYLVLRFNPETQPDACRKSKGDVDFTDWWQRDIPEYSLGGFQAGINKVKELRAIERVIKAGVKAPRSAIEGWVRSITPNLVLTSSLAEIRRVANTF